MLRSLLRCTLTAAALAALQSATPAQAQGFPSSPVTIIVPLAPGTGMDSLVRLYAERLAKRSASRSWSRTSRAPA